MFACGDDTPAATDTDASTGATTDTSAGDSDTSAGDSASTGTSASTSASDSSGSPTTSGVDGSTGTGSTGTGSTGAGTTDGSSTDGTSGGVCEPLPPDPDGWPCMDDVDCEVYGDCCGCTAFNPNMGAPGNCGGNCPQDVCEELALDTAVCQGGFCQVLGLSCDQSAVLCDGLPPDCDPGTLPGVADDCWSGGCIPVEFCDWVPDCDTCPDDQICVIVQTESCDQFDCVPPFPECGGGAPTCECLGEVVCEAPYTTCAIEDDAVVCS